MSFSKLAIASAFAIVSAQAPTKPVYPTEFSATITRTDNQNHTDVTTTSLSASSNAIVDAGTDPRTKDAFTDVTDFGAHRNYFVTGTPAVCHERPERGQIQDRIPDLRAISYNGTGTFQGQAVYIWNDHRDLEYLTTQDKNQYPVAFTDARNGFTEVYSNFAAQTAGSWPAGTFAKPASCA